MHACMVFCICTCYLQITTVHVKIVGVCFCAGHVLKECVICRVVCEYEGVVMYHGIGEEKLLRKVWWMAAV